MRTSKDVTPAGVTRRALWPRLVGCLAVLCLAASGCGATPAGVALAHQRGPGGRDGRAAAASHRLAVRQAQRLLALARVPAGAVPVGTAGRALSGPAMGTPAAGRSLIDKARMWQVPMPFGAAQAWLRAHPPAGLRHNGSMRVADSGGTTMTGLGFAGPRSPDWASASLEVGVAPAPGGGSVIRADGVVVWLDPRPVRVPPGGDRLRLTVAGGCPRTDRHVTGVTSTGVTSTGVTSTGVTTIGGLRHRLLPAGSPTGGLVCRYNGQNGRTWRLTGSRRLTAGQAARLAQRLGRLPLSHPDGGAVSCPMDDGSATFIALSYPGRPDVDLMVSLGGCGGISNGFIDGG
jgi:hypothetical protein